VIAFHKHYEADHCVMFVWYCEYSSQPCNLQRLFILTAVCCSVLSSLPQGLCTMSSSTLVWCVSFYVN